MPFWIKKWVKSNTGELCGVTQIDNMRQIKPQREAQGYEGVERDLQV